VRGTSDKGRQRQITAVERQIRTAQQQTTADNSGQPQTTAVRRRITAVERQITTGQQQITAENSGQRQTTAVRRRITAGQRQIAAINGRQNQTMSPGKEGSPIQSVEPSGLRRAPSLENSATITPAAAGRRNYGAPESRWEGFEVTGVLVTKGRGAPAQRPAGSESPVTTASDRQTDQPQHTGKVSVNSANANRDGQQSAPAVRPNGSEADASRDDANRLSRRESQGDGRGSIEKLNTVLRTTSITAEDAGQRQITAVQRQITGEQQQLTPIQQQTISAKGRGAKAPSIGQGFRDSGVQGPADNSRQRQTTAVQRQITTEQQQLTPRQQQTISAKGRGAEARPIGQGFREAGVQVTAGNSRQRQITQQQTTADNGSTTADNGR